MGAPPIPIDKFTGAVMCVDHDLGELIEGHAFMAHYEGVGAGAGEETAVGFLTPALPTRIHMIVDAWANDESVFEIREDPAIVLDAGTAYQPLIRERALDAGGQYPSAMIDRELEDPDFISTWNVAEAAAAGLAGGAILHHETLAVATGPPFSSALNIQSKAQRGLLLIPSTEYVMILTQSGAGAATHNIILNWHEHISSHYKH